MKKLFLLFILASFFHSCSDPSSNEPSPSADSYHIPLTQAIAEVENCLEAIDPGTRSGGRRQIGECYLAGAETGFTRATDATESSDSPSVYIVNFTNDEGYAIVATDLRAPGTVLAVTDSGHLGPDDRIEVPGAIVFLERLDEAYRSNLATIPPPDFDLVFDRWTASEQGRHCKQIWGQRKPYNLYAPHFNGEPAPAGCTATALAQFLTTYKYPTKYNWELMSKHMHFQSKNDCPDAHTMIGLLFREISLPNNLDMQFGPKASGAYLQNVPRTLKNLGFREAGRHYNYYDEETVSQALANDFPVLVTGYGTRIENKASESRILGIPIAQSYSYSDGHTWLVDVEVYMYRYANLYYKDGRFYKSFKQEQRLIHCNFGWSGLSNGFYNSGVFNTSQPVIPDNRAKPCYQFQYLMQMCFGAKI